MKCILKEGIYQRVDEETADIRLKQGWVLVSKADWKTNKRSVRSETTVVADTKGQITKNKKAEKAAKLKSKQRTPEYTDKLI